MVRSGSVLAARSTMAPANGFQVPNAPPARQDKRPSAARSGQAHERERRPAPHASSFATHPGTRANLGRTLGAPTLHDPRSLRSTLVSCFIRLAKNLFDTEASLGREVLSRIVPR